MSVNLGAILVNQTGHLSGNGVLKWPTKMGGYLGAMLVNQ
jgi:hypothetical protein